MSAAPVSRCPWPTTPLYIAYHDREWGMPVRDDCELFQHLILDGAQAGLSWLTILNKRENYRVAFDQFDPEKIAHYDERKVAALLANPGIVRNRLKIASAITNARAFLAVQESGTGFSELLCQFVGGRTIQHARRTMAEVPARTPESDAMSRELGAHGFKFVGSTICYAFMQAVGMVNDHLVSCFRHAELHERVRSLRRRGTWKTEFNHRWTQMDTDTRHLHESTESPLR
ncbi:MAG: DNA-3-methyladenine glycosylase I [Verrucomicrobiota bacterium]|jgi:DNA-3-methyladenine glycosylase I